MGGKQAKPEPPKEPEKTVAELTKEAKKGLDNMCRDFRREIMRLDMDAKKIKKDLEKAVKKDEPKSTQKIYATNYLKKQAMINKYKGLEAKMEGVKVSLANITTTAQLTETMQSMNKIMSKTSDAIDVNNIQKTITDFSTATEKQNIIGEMIEDATEMDDMETDDAAADDLIDSIADKNKKPGEQMGQDDTFQDQLADLKS